jgi:hypothetical protein
MASLPQASAIYVGLSEEEQTAQQAETSTDVDSGIGMTDADYQTDSTSTTSNRVLGTMRSRMVVNTTGITT